MTKKAILLLSLVFACSSAAKANLGQDRGPSTPEERKRAVEIASLLENDPFNKDAKALTSELVFFLVQAPDIHVHLCSDVLGDYKKIKGDYSPIIISQLTFSQGRFVIEHPEQAGDWYLESMAGVEGVLRTYQNMKRSKPKVKISGLEELLAKQQAGQLSDFVKTVLADCMARQ